MKGLKQPLTPAVHAAESTAALQKWCLSYGWALAASVTMLLSVIALAQIYADMIPGAPEMQGIPQSSSAAAATAVAKQLLNFKDQWSAIAAQTGTAAGMPEPHPFSNMRLIYSLPAHDTSPRCQHSEICDGNHTCGADALGCVTSAWERQQRIKAAIKWSWEGYRQHAWGDDEVDAVTKKPHAWFHLGLTIVDSLDTLLIAGMQEEFQQARHWVANHLEFHDGSTVQFFEVNIRILGGLLSAYYLSNRDEMFLFKAQALTDRLMVAFNTSSGIPTRMVALSGDAQTRIHSSKPDAQTNLAEAGTISMEFTTIGRLLGRDDMFDAGMQFWYVLMANRNFSGLYCKGITTRTGECLDAKMTIGSSADSMYEYMLKQWLLSSKTQEVPLQLYKEAASGIRTYLVRHISDASDDIMSFISEATANKDNGAIGDVNDRFEHLTCFAGGMFVLGKLHGLCTNVTANDPDDITMGARIGKACYELYHQSPSGLAPDSVHFSLKSGGNLPPSSQERVQPPTPTAPDAAAVSAAAHRALLSAQLGKNVSDISRAHDEQQQNQTQQVSTANATVSMKHQDQKHMMNTPGSASIGSRHHLGKQLQPQPPGKHTQAKPHRQHGANQTADANEISSDRAGSQLRLNRRHKHTWQKRGHASKGHLRGSGRQLLGAVETLLPVTDTVSRSSAPHPRVAIWTQKSKADFLRPEAVETLFYLWRATGDELYREWGWSMFRAFEKWCRLESGGYATIADVTTIPPKHANKMESFWIAETLKYFYLLFEDDATVLPLNQWVFNTEAHPLPMWGSPADNLAMKQTRMRRLAAQKDKEKIATASLTSSKPARPFITVIS